MTRPARPATTSTATFAVVPVDELFENHDEFSVPPTDALAGRRLSLAFEDGIRAEVEFGAERVRWSASAALPWGTSGDDAYEAVTVREGIFSVTLERLADRSTALVVFDLNRSRVAVVITEFVDDGEDGVREQTRVLQAALDGAAPDPFPRTDELAGLRVHYRYSSTHAFEHIYVDPDSYVWHGIEGPEAGMGGFEPAEAYLVAEQLYLFTWHERASPFNGTIVVDLREGRSIGRLAAWHLERREAMAIPTGTTATVLNATSYDGL